MTALVVGEGKGRGWSPRVERLQAGEDGEGGSPEKCGGAIGGGMGRKQRKRGFGLGGREGGPEECGGATAAASANSVQSLQIQYSR